MRKLVVDTSFWLIFLGFEKLPLAPDAFSVPFQGMLLKMPSREQRKRHFSVPLLAFEKHPLKGNRESVRWEAGQNPKRLAKTMQQGRHPPPPREVFDLLGRETPAHTTTLASANDLFIVFSPVTVAQPAKPLRRVERHLTAARAPVAASPATAWVGRLDGGAGACGATVALLVTTCGDSTAGVTTGVIKLDMIAGKFGSKTEEGR